MYWEYMTVDNTQDHKVLEKINELGKEQWELVSVIYQETGTASNRYVAFLKRQLQGTR